MERENKSYDSISTILVAVFISTSAINLIVTRLLPSLTNFMTALYILTGVGLIGNNIVRRGIHRLTIRTGHLAIMILLSLYYASTLLMSKSSLSIPFFAVFVLLSLMIPILSDVDIKNLLRIVFILPSLGIIRLSSVLALTSNGIISMGECYALLIPIVSVLTYLLFYFKADRVRVKLILLPSIIVNALYSFFIVVYGSRGPILSIILCFAFLLIFRKRNDQISWKQTWKVIALTIVIAFAMVFFWEIIDFVSTISLKYGIDIRSVSKLYKLRQVSTIWNGRDDIYKVAINGIAEKPILGHGISTFQNNTGIIYPHNFILQILYDGGIVLLCALLIPMICGTINVIRRGTKEDIAYFSLLFFASVPGALFSGDCWKNGCLWLLLGVFLAGKIPSGIQTRSKMRSRNAIN